MAPQVLYCTQVTEKTQKWRSFHQKTITQKIQGAASAQSRINQKRYHQIENRWATEQALTQYVTIIHLVVTSLLLSPGIVIRRMKLSVTLEAL